MPDVATIVVVQSASPLWPTLIGAGSALAGGFVAAWWQTSRADRVAQKIRQAERREQGILAAQAKLAAINAAQLALYYQAKKRQGSSQYQTALNAISDLKEFWVTEVVATVPDEPILRKYAQLLDVVFRDLPAGDLGREIAEGLAKGQGGDRFVENLGHVIDAMVALRSTVYEAVIALQPRPRQPSRIRTLGSVTRRWVSAAATKPWSWLPRIGARRSRGRRP